MCTRIFLVHQESHSLVFSSPAKWRKCTLGWGVNGKGFNFILTMVKGVPLTPLEKICPLKNVEVGLQTPLLHQTPYMAYGKGRKLKIWILCLPWSICIHNNLKWIIIQFKQKLDVIYRPYGHVLSLKLLFLVQNGCFCHICHCRYEKPFIFSIKRFSFSS